ncbi:MAG: DUF721 domain-containing protein [Rhodanobacteraceae bacterium]|nr:DUF721 domain-containing protein [Rhodanobacteraceae bacterium]
MPRYPALGETLQDLPGLVALVQQARRIADLDQRLRACLPPRLAAECRLANVRDGNLVFLARTPDWASKLRLSSRQLLHEASLALGVSELRLTVKVARPDANSPFA